MEYYQSEIIFNQEIAPDIFLMEVTRNKEEIEPGQFFMLKTWRDELTFMRPISVYNVLPKQVQFMYRVAGKGTELLSNAKPGDAIQLLGPLGTGFPYKEVHGEIALLGGGIGIPPLFETAKKLKALNNKLTVYLGFKKELFAIDDFAGVADHLFIASEEGEEGYRGFITDLLTPEKFDAVFTCGPEVMMEKVWRMCKEKQVPVWLSMERRMACGIGACLGCNCDTIHGTVRACKEGPVFSGDDLVF